MSSLSASGRSNGERLDSASAATMKMTKPAAPHGVNTCQWGTKPHFQPACAATMPVVESVPAAHDDRHDGEQQRQLVADQLRQGAHRGEQRVLVVARPAGHEDRQLGRGAGGEEVEDAGVQVDRQEVAAVRDDGEGQEGEGDEGDRRQEVQHAGRRRAGRCPPWSAS